MKASEPAPPQGSIFADTTRLAEQLGAVNLGQGFPDSGPPPLLETALQTVLMGQVHQYSPPQGLAQLRVAVADSMAPALGYLPDPDAEITITAGATEALYASTRALLRPGDRVVVLEPFYDLYITLIQQAGAQAVGVPLRPGADGWRVDLDALTAAFQDRVAMVIVNTPHNPTGTVLTSEELTALARLIQQSDTVVLTDEVYDQLTYSRPHQPLAAFPGMRERTVTVGAASKTFSVTGWRIGWAVAPASITAALRAVHQYTTFAAPTPLQAAVALALSDPGAGAYYSSLRTSLIQRRDLLSQALQQAGLPAGPAEGGYFLLADTTALSADASDAARRLLQEIGIAGIPISAFYPAAAHVEMASLVRLAFCKSPAVIDEAVRRLRPVL